MIENNLERGIFLFCFCLLTYISQSQSIVEGSQGKNSSVAGTWRRELKQRPWRNSTCCLAPCGSFSPGPPAWSCTTHSGLAPPVSVINQENALQAFPTAQSDGGSFSIDFLFFPKWPRDSNLSQVGKKLSVHLTPCHLDKNIAVKPQPFLSYLSPRYHSNIAII